MGSYWDARIGEMPSLPDTLLYQATYLKHVMYVEINTPYSILFHERSGVSSIYAKIKWWKNWVTMPSFTTFPPMFTANQLSLPDVTMYIGRGRKEQVPTKVTKPHLTSKSTTKMTYNLISSSGDSATKSWTLCGCPGRQPRCQIPSPDTSVQGTGST